ncbi:MAG: ATP-binding protein [Chloroflexota bacterium]
MNTKAAAMDDLTRSSLALLLEISRELSTSLELRTVLARVLLLSTVNVGAERGSLIVLSESGQPVEAALAINGQIYHPTVEHMQSILDHGLAGWVAQRRQPALIANTAEDERWTRRPDDSAERTGNKSAVCVPLFSSGQLTGVLTLVHAQTGFFSYDHLTLLQGIADMAGIAVRNAHLYRSIQEAQRRYRELFEDSIDPILITDWQGSIQEANRQALQMTAYPADQLIALGVEWLQNEQTAPLASHFDRLRAGGTVSYETQLIRRDGSPLPVEVHIRRVTIGENEMLQWILRDIRERKQLDTLRDDLAAMIYHDLRSPLANIISSLDILQTILPADAAESIQPVFQIAVRAADRLQRLISSLLDINRLEAGQAITSKTSFQPQTLLNEAVDMTHALAESKHQSLSTVVTHDLPSISADADMIRRVLINLIENAIKYTPMQGKIEVGCRHENGTLRFWVKDSGLGIPADALELIFEKFNRLQGDRYPKGLGLGLAFCRLAVRAHGGKIWVESKLGEGSLFVFTLPVE